MDVSWNQLYLSSPAWLFLCCRFAWTDSVKMSASSACTSAPASATAAGWVEPTRRSPLITPLKLHFKDSGTFTPLIDWYRADLIKSPGPINLSAIAKACFLIYGEAHESQHRPAPPLFPCDQSSLWREVKLIPFNSVIDSLCRVVHHLETVDWWTAVGM